MTDKYEGFIVGILLGVLLGIAATIAFNTLKHNKIEQSPQTSVATETPAKSNSTMPFGAIEITLIRGNCSGWQNGPEYTLQMNSYGDVALDCRQGGRSLKPIHYNVGYLSVYNLAAILYSSGYFELEGKYGGLQSHGKCITTRVRIGELVNEVYDFEGGLERLDAMEYLIEVVGETEKHLPKGFRPISSKGGSYRGLTIAQPEHANRVSR